MSDPSVIPSGNEPSAAQPWEPERVLALAPDAASVTAARKLAVGPGWSEVGCSGQAVWGAATGSGKTPYYVAVDLNGPAYKCSCPSRKIPCKHVLGLLLRWAQSEVGSGEPPEYVTQWLEARSERAERATSKVAKPPDPVAQAKRAEQRVERVTGGLIELDRWLTDQVRAGLVQLQGRGYSVLDGLAARMVDAQAPGVAAWVRGLAALLAGGPGWVGDLLEELALLRLLVRAHERLPDLDVAAPDLAATVRTHVGYPTSKESVLARPGVPDLWTVWRVRDVERDLLLQRTAYLGSATGRSATVLSFAAGGAPLDDSLAAGTSFEATLHYYPASWPQRALVAERGDSVEPVAPQAVSVETALSQVARAVAADPWLRSLPVWVRGEPVEHDAGWMLADDLGDAVPLRVGPELWPLVAACSGRPEPVLVEWGPRGWVPLAAHLPDSSLVAL